MFPPEQPTASFPYRIEERVGTGSMGIVYRAREVELDRTVAIKILRKSVLDEETPAMQRELRQRFRQEARAAAALSHPGVTTVFRVGEDEGLPYLVMEWLDGTDLEEILNSRKRFAVSRVARIGVAVLDVLAAAHRGGVVHRDIKPSNLVILRDGRLKVTDFGIALLKRDKLVKTHAGVVLATPRFASPEQLQGSDVDGRSDLFAVGILLYRCLSGQYPFEGRSFLELANNVLQVEPIPVREHRPEIPPGFEAILRRALSRNRQDRYPTAEDMADELRPYMKLAAKGSFPAVASPSGSPKKQDPQAGSGKSVETLVDLPLDMSLGLAAAIKGWPGRWLESQPTQDLLGQLLSRPLHAPPFAGALVLDQFCLLISHGILLGAIDCETGATGDEVVEALPEEGAPELHPLPEEYPRDGLMILASILYPPVHRHSDLDSSFINLPALAGKLKEEKFNGIFRLSRGSEYGLFSLAEGEVFLKLFSQGWRGVPVKQSWQQWISNVPVRASVSEKFIQPAGAWYERAFEGLEFEVRPTTSREATRDRASARKPVDTSSSKIRQLLQSGRSGPAQTGRLILRLAPSPASAKTLKAAPMTHEGAPAFRILQWLTGQLPGYLTERSKTGQWKYLAEWIPKVRKAFLYHEIPLPGSRATERFDLVTTDAGGKILHLGQRLPRVTGDVFRRFNERVVATKKAYKKKGDIGGVMLVSPCFDDEAMTAYDKAVHGGTGSWFEMEESFTGYSGFVRIGARRGFHLLLVEEKDGELQPIL